MKLISILVAAGALLAGTTIQSLRSGHLPSAQARGGQGFGLVSAHLSSMSHLQARWGVVPLASSPLQAGSAPGGLIPAATIQTTPSGTSTAVPATPAPTAVTPTLGPSPTATGPAYPDPVTILQTMISVYGRITSAHYDVITDGDETGVEHLHLDFQGDAICKAMAFTAHVTGTDSLLGTTQATKLNTYFIVIGKKAWTKSKATRLRWKSTTVAKVTGFGFSVTNPLLCPSSSSGGSSGGTNTQIKDVLNLGPDTFKGVAVWHIRATEVAVDTAGNTSQAQLDFLIGQDHYLPYVFTVLINDPSTKITLTQKQVLTKFGEKIKIAAPKVGSAKP